MILLLFFFFNQLIIAAAIVTQVTEFVFTSTTIPTPCSTLKLLHSTLQTLERVPLRVAPGQGRALQISIRSVPGRSSPPGPLPSTTYLRDDLSLHFHLTSNPEFCPQTSCDNGRATFSFSNHFCNTNPLLDYFISNL